MSLDDDAGPVGDDDDLVGFSQPLPPEDRLWRHPSEMGAFGDTFGDSVLATAASAGPSSEVRRGAWATALVAGLVGAALSAGVLAVTGFVGPRVIERDVVEKVALTPLGASSLLQTDRGVAALAEKVGPAIARLELRQDGDTTVGSGVLFRSDGHLLTSARLVSGASAIAVVLHDGRRLTGHLVGVDPLTDVAVVRVDARELPVAVMGTSSDVTTGDSVVALGTPAGPGRGPSITRGVISALRQQVAAIDGEYLHGVIETDVPHAAAAAGGALIDRRGAVVGITTMADPASQASSGYAVPAEVVRWAADELMDVGRVRHCWLGVRGADLDPGLAADLGIGGGAVVRSVDDPSPASVAGLEADDVITDLGGDEVDSITGLVVELRDHEPGQQVVVGVQRDGERVEIDVTLGERDV